MIVMGVDPGLSGAVAFYDPEFPAWVDARDIPVAGGEVDVDALVALIRGHTPSRAVIERVSSMPKQGVASTFKFGVAYGMARAAVIALEIPYALVTPTKWKRAMGLSSDKELSRALAIRTWPGAGCFARKKDDGRAEAALLALWGCQTNGET